MADNSERLDKPGVLSDTLVVPFIFVPHGAPEPREWLAQHPGAVRIPARFVPRQASNRAGSDWQLRFDPFAALVMGGEEYVHGQSNGHDEISGSSSPLLPGTEDPVAAFLRVNSALAQMGFGRSFKRDGTARHRDQANDVPASSWLTILAADSAPHATPGQPPSSGSQPRNPTTPVPLLDSHGRPMLRHDGTIILRPAGLDPRFFVQQGLKDRQIVEELLQNGSDGSGPAALGYELGALRKFRQGGAWDAQRIGGIFRHEFVDYATIAIGLYAAAAGIPQADILTIQNMYAKYKSRYSKRRKFDRIYKNLPEENVSNTITGYKLYNNLVVR